ncbi:unnamed protein product [Amaranthus hypochondriacus]
MPNKVTAARRLTQETYGTPSGPIPQAYGTPRNPIPQAYGTYSPPY